MQNVQQHARFFRAFGTNVSPGVEFVHLPAIPQDFGFSVNGCRSTISSVDVVKIF